MLKATVKDFLMVHWKGQRIVVAIFATTVIGSSNMNNPLGQTVKQRKYKRGVMNRKVARGGALPQGWRKVRLGEVSQFSKVAILTINERLKNVFSSEELQPDSVIRKFLITASDSENYLTDGEMESLGRIVSSYLDLAEDRAKRKIPMTMEDWSKRLDKFLELYEHEILQDSGKISAQIAKDHAESEFEKYRIVQDRLFQSDFDKETQALIKQIGQKNENSNQ